jgi:hypothetical protein
MLTSINRRPAAGAAGTTALNAHAAGGAVKALTLAALSYRGSRPPAASQGSR